MTIEEYQNNQNFEQQLESAQVAFLRSIKDVMGAQVVRIFEEGKNSSDGTIGKYNSENELYVADGKSPIKGNHKGKHGKAITTTYYESYEDFRGRQGRQTGAVNLRLFGRLMSDLANARVDHSSVNTDKLPNEMEPIKVQVDGGFEYITLIRSENADKKKGAEARYGKIFDHTQDEKDRFFKTLNFELGKINA